MAGTAMYILLVSVYISPGGWTGEMPGLDEAVPQKVCMAAGATFRKAMAEYWGDLLVGTTARCVPVNKA